MCMEKCLLCPEGKNQGIYNELGYLMEEERVCTNPRYSLISGKCPHDKANELKELETIAADSKNYYLMQQEREEENSRAALAAARIQQADTIALIKRRAQLSAAIDELHRKANRSEHPENIHNSPEYLTAQEGYKNIGQELANRRAAQRAEYNPGGLV